MKRLKAAAGVALIVGAGAAQGLAQVDVIFSRALGSPTSSVPLAVDLNGDPMAATFVSMFEFWISPDGTRWLVRGGTDAGSDLANYLILGSGTSAIMNLQEGRPFPGAVGAELLDFHSSTVMNPFDASNNWAFTIRARGGTASNGQKMVKFTNAGVGSRPYQQGDLYTGLVDSPVGNSGDETLGNSFGTISLLNDGRVYWQDSTVGSISTTRRPVTAVNAQKHLQVPLDAVTAISGAGNIVLTNIPTGGIAVSPDGSRIVLRANVDQDDNGTNLPTDPVGVVVDGQVRVQVGQTTPGGSGIVPSSILQIAVAPNNDWYARGADSAGVWALKNGTVIAKTGESIGQGNLGGTIFSIAGNVNGDWVLAGKSDDANTAVDDVIVVNGQVVLREGDAVQVPGVGTAYIGRANNSLAAFSGSGTSIIGIGPDRTVYVISSLRSDPMGGSDLAPSGVPYALIRIQGGGGGDPCPGDFNADNSVDLLDLLAFNAQWSANLGTNVAPGTNGDYNGNGVVDLLDLLAFNADWSSNLGQTCP